MANTTSQISNLKGSARVVSDAQHPLEVILVDNSGTDVSVTAETQYNEDDAAVANPVGGVIQLRRRDALVSEVSADGDILTLNGTSKGEAYVSMQGQVLDLDTGAGTSDVQLVGIALHASGSPVAGGTSTNPLRIDPTGTTAQPVT